MPVNIHNEHGYIIGGVCDQTHRDRSARERGGQSAVDWLTTNGVFRHVGGGWWRLTKSETKAERELDWRAKENIAGPGAQRKVGCYRVFDDLLPAFRKKGKAFRLSFFMKCVEDIEGLEFGMAAWSERGLWSPLSDHSPRAMSSRIGMRCTKRERRKETLMATTSKQEKEND